MKYPRRISRPLSEEDSRTLASAKIHGRVDAAMRHRAMIRLWQQNDTIVQRVNSLAHRMLDGQREETRKRLRDLRLGP